MSNTKGPFVAIVTPAIKHLRKEIARLSAEEMPA